MLLDQRAVAVPFVRFRAHWSQRVEGSDPIQYRWLSDSIEKLAALDILDADRLVSDHRSGWYVASDIPTGCGMGSSGAFCAALYDRYRMYHGNDFQQIQDELILLESVFHSTSSGVDPMVSFMERGLVLSAAQEPVIIDPADLNLNSVFLWDSDMPRESRGLVETFLRKQTEPGFAHRWSQEYMPALNCLRDDLLLGADMSQTWRQLSELQLDMLSEMIPMHVSETWRRGLITDSYYFKLCGAGGGGYYLVYLVEEDADLELIPIEL